MVGALDEEPALAMPKDATIEVADSFLDHGVPSKRRKVRKGTRSCWECKRRKIRCIFASSEDAKCVCCQRRRLPCVSQDLPEDLSPARKGNRHLSERISRVEDFMKQYLANKDSSSTRPTDGQPPWDRHSLAESETHVNGPAPLSDQIPPTPEESQGESASTYSIPAPRSQRPTCQAESEKVALHHLLAAFPAEEDAKILFEESSTPSLYTIMLNTQPHSKLTSETLATPYPTAKLPGPNTHPVVLAKFMLIFAITLQSPAGEKLVSLSEPRGVLMRRLMMAATTWVTTKEEMHETLESLICIVLEGVFELNCGNLRRAWVVYRRAMTVALLMGLNRFPLPPVKRINPKMEAKPDFIWFRIVYMDRYLSLLLGLPQGTSDKSMGVQSTLQNEPPLGKFERRLTVIASRILERNERPFDTSEITITQFIDTELLDISKSMPASFWCAADFRNLTPGSPDTLLETMRLGAQVYYYGLLIHLHLPYLMRIANNTGREYSKITCVNASREILARFIAHRTFDPKSSCSRPVDFFTLLAAMALLLAHLDAHHHRDTTNFLAHQRLSDRALLDQALGIMNIISDVNKDIISGETAKLIGRLLDIEADAAEGSNYTARNVGGEEEVQEDAHEGEGLRLRVPYLGVVKIARQGPISREPLDEDLGFWPHQSSPAGHSPQEDTPFRTIPREPPMIDQTISPGQVCPFSHDIALSDLPIMPSPTTGYEHPIQCPSSSHNNIALQSQMGLPPIAAGVNDWAFQGVDMAFFDSLMRGTSSIDDIDLGQ